MRAGAATLASARVPPPGGGRQTRLFSSVIQLDQCPSKKWRTGPIEVMAASKMARRQLTSGVLEQWFAPIAHPSDWSGKQGARARLATATDLTVALSAVHLHEIDNALMSLRRSLDLDTRESMVPQQALLGTDRSMFLLGPALTQLLAHVRRELLDGAALVILTKLPEQYTKAEIGLVLWGLGLHLGHAVPQSTELDDVLGEVTPAGGAMAVRGYRNSTEQNLHSDGVVDFVGMACAKPAGGGEGAGMGMCIRTHIHIHIRMHIRLHVDMCRGVCADMCTGASRYSSAMAAFNDMANEPNAAEMLSPLFRGFRLHLGEHLAVTRPANTPSITPQPVPILTFGPRILGTKARSATSLSAVSAHLASAQSKVAAAPSRSDRVLGVNVRYLRSYIDDAAIELASGTPYVRPPNSAKLPLPASARVHAKRDQVHTCTDISLHSHFSSCCAATVAVPSLYMRTAVHVSDSTVSCTYSDRWCTFSVQPVHSQCAATAQPLYRHHSIDSSVRWTIT